MDAPILRLDHYSSPKPHSFTAEARVALEITRGRVQQRMRSVPGRVFLIGTASDCDLVLGDLQFPEAYAYLFVDGDHVTVRWLGAGPRLSVSGEVVETSDLFHGDVLAFGPFELRVLIDGPPREPKALAVSQGQGNLQPAGEPSNSQSFDEVQTLLDDLRRELHASSVTLRLYEADEPAAARQRDTA